MKKISELFGAIIPITYQLDYHDFRVAAIAAHGKQKYGEYPYAYHLSKVEAVLWNFGYTDYKYLASAWLHDVIEDTVISYENILTSYGEEVAEIVHACSGEGANRAEKQQSILDNLTAYPDAAPVKCADRYVNMEFSLANDLTKFSKYLEEWPAFKAAVMPLMIGHGSSRDAFFWNNIEDKVENMKVKYAKQK